MKHFALFLFAMAGLVVLNACSSFAATPTPQAPSVIIGVPVSGAQYAAGSDVLIQSKANDMQGIKQVELWVDGQSVKTDAIPTGKSQPEFQVAQTWKATTPGTHLVIVRAMNDAGAVGEAALTLTVTEPAKATSAPAITAPVAATVVPPSPTKAPAAPAATSAPPASNPTAPTSAPAPTKVVVPTTVPGAQQYTITLTEAQINTMINNSLAASQVTYVQSASVSLQNGQIGMNVNYTGPGGKSVSGRIIVTVSASNCTLHVAVVQATVGQFSMTEAQKATLNVVIEKAIQTQCSQTYSSYTCIDSVTIANGLMVIKFH